MKKSIKLKKVLDKIHELIIPLEDILRAEKINELRNEVDKIYGFKNDLEEAESDYDDILSERRDLENEVDHLRNKAAEMESEIEELNDNPLKPKTLYDEQKIEILERMHNKYTLENLINIENKVEDIR